MTKEKGLTSLPPEDARSNNDLVTEILQKLAQERAAPGYRSPVTELRWYASNTNGEKTMDPPRPGAGNPEILERFRQPGRMLAVLNARPAQASAPEDRSTRGIWLATRSHLRGLYDIARLMGRRARRLARERKIE